MIDLGLARISKLVGESRLPWRAIHVAGTNGKGSVCAYASSMLHSSGVPCGRFTSPHLVDRWDCISINEKVVDHSLFLHVEDLVKSKNSKASIGASEFELLTATAFEIFAHEKIEVGVVEVGLGGRLDATNVIQHPLATVITKIGMDHEDLLGNTLDKIAFQKAGIMKPGSPCLADGSNPPEVLQVFEDYSRHIAAGPLTPIYATAANSLMEFWDHIPWREYEEHQLMNIALAYHAVEICLLEMGLPVDLATLAIAIERTKWPGRLQTLDISSITGRREVILLDGAHNPQSAAALGSYVDRRLRRGSSPVTWVLAASNGKDLKGMLSLLVKPGDNIGAVEFGHVDGMPWVKPRPAHEIVLEAKTLSELGNYLAASNLKHALQWATEMSNGDPIVVAGSLYLVSDLLRLLRTLTR